jgi:hypothetical protein
MRFYIMTLVSIIAVLAVKSYTTTAQDTPLNDVELEVMADFELLNKQDTIRHRKMINRFIQPITQSEVVYGKFKGSGPFTNETYINFERLKRTATQYELNELLLNENPVVRVYAHKALVSNQMEIRSDIAESLVQDSSEVIIIDGFKAQEMMVMDIVSESIFPQPIEVQP